MAKIKSNVDTSNLADYKVIIVGESRIGKSSILNKLSNDIFKENTISTVGIDFVNSYHQIDNVKVKLQIWDTAGQERFRSITKSHYRNARGILLAFDLTDRDTFDTIEYWFSTFPTNQVYTSIVYLIGNKSDLSHREVSYEEAKQFADQNLFKYFETSAKTGFNLRQVFDSLAFDLLDAYDSNKMDRYKLKSYQPSDCFVYSYNLPTEIAIKERLPAKSKRRHLNKFLRRNKNKNMIVGGAATSTAAPNVHVKNKNVKIKLSKKEARTKSPKSKHFENLNCCKVS